MTVATSGEPGPLRDPRRSLVIGASIALIVLLVLVALLATGAAVVMAGRPG